MSETVISYEEFSRLNIRIGKIVYAEKIRESRKLVKLIVDLGELGERQIIAGIGDAYTDESLLGKKIVVLTNLKPKRIMGMISQGMLLASGCEKGGKPVLIVPEKDVKAGSRVC